MSSELIETVNDLRDLAINLGVIDEAGVKRAIRGGRMGGTTRSPRTRRDASAREAWKALQSHARRSPELQRAVTGVTRQAHPGSSFSAFSRKQERPGRLAKAARGLGTTTTTQTGRGRLTPKELKGFRKAAHQAKGAPTPKRGPRVKVPVRKPGEQTPRSERRRGQARHPSVRGAGTETRRGEGYRTQTSGLYVPVSLVMFEERSRTTFRSCPKPPPRSQPFGYSSWDHFADKNSRRYPLSNCLARLAGNARQAKARGRDDVISTLNSRSKKAQAGSYKPKALKFHTSGESPTRPYPPGHKKHGQRSGEGDTRPHGRGGREVTVHPDAYKTKPGKKLEPRTKGKRKREAASRAVSGARAAGVRRAMAQRGRQQ